MCSRRYSIKKDTQSIPDDALIRESSGGMSIPEEGERYLLFLQRWTGGTYISIQGFMGMYRIEGENASRYIPEGSPDIAAAIKRGGDPETLEGLRTVVRETAASYTPPTPITFEDIYDELMKWAHRQASADTTERTLKMLECYEKLVSLLRERAAKAEVRPTAVVLGEMSYLTAAGGDMFQSYLIETAGGTNAAAALTNKGDFSDITLEQLSEWDPEYIFVPSGARWYYLIDEVIKEPGWSELSAVKNGKVFTLPSTGNGAFDLPIVAGGANEQVCLGALFVLHCLHPELYTYDELIANATEFLTLSGGTPTHEKMGF